MNTFAEMSDDLQSDLSRCVCDVDALSQHFRLSESHASGIAIGIMGGTFDPIHIGHLFCAEQAKNALGLAGVIFMPAGDPAFKQGRDIASAYDRLEMCKLAVADNPAFEVSALELKRNGITYTSDTLRQLRDELQDDVKIVFIMGSDSLVSMEEWHDAYSLANLAEFACITRQGIDEDNEAAIHLAKAGFKIHMVKSPLLAISSTEIRRRCARGESIRYLTPLSVCEYIERRGLYKELELNTEMEE